VKSRASAEFGEPEDAVDLDKRRNLQHAAASYLRRARLDMSVARFDIVSVVFDEGPKIHHIEDAFGTLLPL
jgi:putative endonuclease